MGVITPSCMLLCSTRGGWLLLRETLTPARIAGALPITAGIVTLGWDGLANHGEQTWLGDAMFALGGLLWASYTIGSRVWRVEPLHVTAVVGVLSMLAYLPLYTWLAGADLAAAPWREVAIPLLRELPTSLQIAGVLFVTAGMLLALGLHDPARWRVQPASLVAPR